MIPPSRKNHQADHDRARRHQYGKYRNQYRERSPLVIPPRSDLPPPAAAAEAPVPNWPKDPDIQNARPPLPRGKRTNKDPREASPHLDAGANSRGQDAAGKGSAGPDLPGNPGATAILSRRSSI